MEKFLLTKQGFENLEKDENGYIITDFYERLKQLEKHGYEK